MAQERVSKFALGTFAYYGGTEGFIQCTYQAAPCGCSVQGNGTLPNPLRIKFCPAHEAMNAASLAAAQVAVARGQ